MTTLRISPTIRRLNAAVEEFDCVTGGQYDRASLDRIVTLALYHPSVSTRLFQRLVDLRQESKLRECESRPALIMEAPESDREDSP